MENFMKCPYCGREIPAGGRFCEYCGGNLEAFMKGNVSAGSVESRDAQKRTESVNPADPGNGNLQNRQGDNSQGFGAGTNQTSRKVDSQNPMNVDYRNAGEGNSRNSGSGNPEAGNTWQSASGNAASQSGGNRNMNRPAEGEKKKKHVGGKMKNVLLIVLAVLLVISIASCSVNLSSYNTLSEQYSELQEDYESLSSSAENQLYAIRSAYEDGDWQTVIDLAAELHESHNGSDEDVEAQELAEQSQQNLDDEAAAAAEEEAQEYETGITYEQLARNPDDYEGEKVTFTGEVVQVMEDTDYIEIRLAVDGDYDTIIYGGYDSSIVDSRVLEEDTITIYGVSVGTVTYETVLGDTVTIPGVEIDRIDQ